MTDFYPLAESMIHRYLDKPGLVKGLIGTYWVQREPMLELYESWVYKKELDPVEKLPIEEKKRLWTLAKDWCRTGGTKERIETLKSIYLIESATQKKIG